jgi:hypothetical protein
MARGHRSIIRRLAAERLPVARVKCTILDTPYRFQSNAAALSAGLVDFFGRRLGMDAAVATFAAHDDVVGREAAYARIRDSPFVFSGPGSPSYALRQWRDSEIPSLFAEKLTAGGALVLASAAALTLGRVTLPVYEIYKSGADAHWLDGLDVLSAVGINAAVVPHFDNAEGSGHDTRFCFVGEARFRELEEQLPADTFVLGLDEHTALVADFDSGRATVHGRGGVTLRRGGRQTFFAAGEDLALDELVNVVPYARSATAARPAAADNDSRDLARRLLTVERELADLRTRARLVAPLVELILDMRRQARAMGAYEAADSMRDQLLELGIGLSDGADGSTEFRLP